MVIAIMRGDLRMNENEYKEALDLRYKQQRDILIWNTVRVIGFIVLAIVFGHWWISLFSILFLVSAKE